MTNHVVGDTGHVTEHNTLSGLILGAACPMFVGRLTAAQTLATGTVGTALTLDTEDVDHLGEHSTTTNPSRYTAQTGGWYWAAGDVTFAANATANRSAELAVNGALLNSGGRTIVPAATGGSRITVLNVVSLVFLNVGDYLELRAWQESGGNLNVTAARLSVKWTSA